MRATIILFLTVVLYINSLAQTNSANSDEPSGKVWGLAFGDYFYKTGGDSTGNQLQYTPYNKNFNAFDFRRIFLGYDYNFNAKFFASFVLSYEGNTFTPAGDRTVVVKDAYLKWKEIYTYATATFGLMPTIGYSVASEKVWAYRSIEKTIMDQRGILGSRDLGVMLNGAFDKGMNYGYHFMISNGTGLKFENNKFKKFSGNLLLNFLNKKLIVDVYGDFEPNNNDKDNTTFDGFLGYQTKNFSAGAEYFFQLQKNAASSTTPGGPDVMPSGISFFVNGNLYKDKLKFFARYDFYNENTKNNSTGFNQSFVTAGLDFMPAPKIHIMPNIWLNAYTTKDQQTTKRLTDVVPRMTFYYDYR